MIEQEIDRENIFAPIQMQQRAIGWFHLYQLGVHGNSSNETKSAAIVCYLFAVEFYLKALIIAIDKTYEDGIKLSKIGHSYTKILNTLEMVADKKAFELAKNFLHKMNLLSIDPISLRYTPTNSHTHYSVDLWRGKIDATELFFKQVEEIIRLKIFG